MVLLHNQTCVVQCLEIFNNVMNAPHIFMLNVVEMECFENYNLKILKRIWKNKFDLKYFQNSPNSQILMHKITFKNCMKFLKEPLTRVEIRNWLKSVFSRWD